MSSFCDMRYSHLNFLDILKRYEVADADISKESVVVTFQAEMEKIHDKERDLEISVEPKTKKARKSFLDDDDKDDDDGIHSVKVQLESYLKEICIKPKECPGAWWRLNKANTSIQTSPGLQGSTCREGHVWHGDTKKALHD